MFRLVANVLGGPKAAGGYGDGHSMPPSDSLVITGASLFMTANKIALFVAFFMATRKNVFIFQGYLVWHHTRPCQEVPCSVMIVLAVPVEKKKKSSHLKKRPPTTLWVGDQQSGGRPISWRYSGGNTVEVGQIKINHDDRMKKKWSLEDSFERLAGWINALNDKDTHLDP